MDWKTALLDLVSARFDLIRIELADWRAQSARRAAYFAVATVAGASAWLLLLAGIVPLLAQALQMSWPITALLLAALHIFLVVFCIAMGRRTHAPAFTATMTEFKKDREWIETISKNKKS
jgi:uncharacterized membrane protein YqjE